MSDSASKIDWDKLSQTLRSTLDSLAQYRIETTRIKVKQGSTVLSGGFGDVRCATMKDRRFGSGDTRNVAIKMLRPAGNDVQRLRVAVALARELKVWGGLDHPNILPLVGFYLSAEHDVAWLVSPWEENGNLSAFLEATKPDEKTRMQLAADTAKGLAYLHERDPPICHGDIKALNVIISEQHRAMLCDFGLARIVEQMPTGLTTSSVADGTIRFLSPEILNDSSPRTLSSDVWAWGCLLLQTTCDIAPYEFEKRNEIVLLRISQNTLPAPLDSPELTLSDTVRSLLVRCWALAPQDRPTMGWCSQMLSPGVASLAEFFNGSTSELPDPSEIPAEVKTEGNDWTMVHSPTSKRSLVVKLKLVVPPSDECVLFLRYSEDGSTLGISDTVKVSVLKADNADVTWKINHPWELGINRNICFSHDGTMVATGHLEGLVQIWDREHDVAKRKLEGHTHSIISLAFLKGDVGLVSASCDSIRIWNPDTGVALHALTTLPMAVSMSVSTINSLVAVGCGDGSIQIINASTGTVLKEIPNNEGGSISAVEFTRDGKTVVAGNWSGGFGLWSIVGDPVKIKSITVANRPIALLSISHDDQWIACKTHLDPNVLIYDRETGVLQMVLILSKGGPFQFSPVAPSARNGGSFAAVNGSSINIWTYFTQL